MQTLMLRLLLSLLICAVHPLLGGAQEPITDLAIANELEDFQVQGEYEGPQRAMQVIALGDGQFEIVLYEGGLPGDGWRGETPRKISGDVDTVEQIVEAQGMEKVNRKSPTLGAQPPEGAVVLFDGTSASLKTHWQNGAQVTDEGLLMQGATSVPVFKDYVLHLEFRTPFQPSARGQGRGNSGVYHQSRYETQVLDSFGLEGRDNEAGGLYSVRPPDLNMCLPPLSWQTYDVIFTAARFDDEGKKVADARMTVRLNGVVIHNDVAVPKSTTAAPMGEGDSAGPIYLQDHGNPVRYRNIWVLPRDAERESRRPLVPGYERFFSSTVEIGDTPSQLAGGRVLASNLGCIQCHQDDVRGHQGDAKIWRSAEGPVLTDVASRLRPDFLRAWIEDPHGVKAGTTMPDLLAGSSEQEKAAMAEALASYLLLAGPDQVWLDRTGDSRAAARGEQLFHTVGCLACHAPRDGRSAPSSTSVPMGEVGAKYSLDSLARFLADPHSVRPDGRMPKLLQPGEARDVATYLLSEIVLVPGAQQWKRTVYRGSWQDLPDFSQLDPVGPAETVNDLTFDGIEPKDNFAASYEAFLPITKGGKYRLIVGSDDGSRVIIDGKEVARVGGIHPYQQAAGEIDLSAGVHQVRVEYFEGGGEERLTLEIEGGDLGRAEVATLVTLDPEGNLNRTLVEHRFVPKAGLVDAGAKYFRTLGCANCHTFIENGAEGAVTSQLVAATSWSQLEPQAGCLAANVAPGVPDYELTSGQRLALSAAIQGAELPIQPAERIHQTLAAANCYACHGRDGIGGPEPAREAFFTTTIQEMGNEGRIPPPLTGIADKLRDETIEQVLQAGANDRPYMLTRMPGFGYEGLEGMHQAMVEVDRRDESTLVFEESLKNRLMADGRTLVGNDGLACIKCHTYNGEGTPGIQAIDMRKMPQRLRSEWFERYLLNPPAYRPGTRMPASFPDGVSVFTKIADGEPSYQIAAMWQYLDTGDPAKLPSGLRPGAIELTPVERPIIYRNFITDLSPRGIAVGYPQRVHLAWDAGSMALAKIWQNQFLDAALHWQGRGPGNLGPLGDAVVAFESTSPVAILSDPQADWPRSTKAEDGYKFLGYRLNGEGQPTFRYRVGKTEVEDFFLPLPANDEGFYGLRRELTIGAADEGLVVRFFAGDIEQVDGSTYRINGNLQVRLEPGGADVVMVDGQKELRLAVPTGQETKVALTVIW